MPRKYRRKVGGRSYKNYEDSTMEKAIQDILAGKLSTRNASEAYNLSRRTLMRKLKLRKAQDCSAGESVSPREVGRPTTLSKIEEEVICSHVIMLADFGFPVTKFELRMLVKGYLDSLGRTETRFKESDNMPGIDWATSFMERHKTKISQRMSRSITRYRAALDRQSLNAFFDNLGVEIDGIPPSNIWNYDETNLQDDPGSKKILVKRGAKHPDIIRNATKAATSIMVCGNAAGELAPVYVVYKAQNVYPGWIEGGPPHTRYNRSKSGWFDGYIFEDWFELTMLPLMRKQIGPKVLIGDNLSSHLNPRVLNLCKDNNIRFVALPAHSTHLLQPLDVSFFRPMKAAWRKIMDDWKRTPEGNRLPTLPKSLFPVLLKKLMDELEPRAADNLKSGFRGTGICPLQREVPLAKLHDAIVLDKQTHVDNVSKLFMTHMENTRKATTEKRSYERKKRVQVPPGKGITIEDLEKAGPSAEPPVLPQSSGSEPTPSLPTKRGRKRLNAPNPKQAPKKKRGRQPRSREEEESSEDDSSEPDDVSSDEQDDHHENDPDEDVDPPASVTPAPPEEIDDDEPRFGDFVVVTYKSKLYPGKMMSDIDITGEACVSAMSKIGDAWIWPNPPDALWYPKKRIVKKLLPPLEMENERFIFAGDF